MRLFVAIDISDAMRAEVGRLQRAIESALIGAARPPRVTWVKESVAHVTLRFIGEVQEDTGEAVQQALNADIPLPSFEVCWDTVGTFPSGRRPRAIWIGASDSAKPFATLARMVNDRLASIVGPPDARDLTPHVTIGRVRELGRGVDWREVVANAVPTRVRDRIDHVTLYRSHLSSKGPTYVALTTASLKQGL